MSSKVLIVCTANVCRSPFAALVLAAALDDGGGAGAAVTSAGTEVDRARHICTVGLELLAEDLPVGDDAKKHAARPVTEELIAGHDLIIAAGLRERSAVAKLDPGARGRTFTLKEAVALGAVPLSVSEQEQMATASADDRDVVRAYADVLNGRRGRIEIPEEAHRLPWKRADPFDIPDVHGARDRTHRRELRALRDRVRVLAGHLHAFSEKY